QGFRQRSIKHAAFGIAGMLACRQEFALVVASLALVPAKRPEDIGRTDRWARGALALGLVWMCWGFFGYLRLMVASSAPEHYMEQFAGPKAAFRETVATASDFALVGMGSWAVLACLAPRLALLALPWVWSLSSGKWA